MWNTRGNGPEEYYTDRDNEQTRAEVPGVSPQHLPHTAPLLTAALPECLLEGGALSAFFTSEDIVNSFDS